MTSRELQVYLSKEENGLLKKINTSHVTIEVSYFPKVLVLRNHAEERELLGQMDSIDYFIAKFNSKSSAVLSQIDIYGSRLVLGRDTLDAVDAMFVQGQIRCRVIFLLCMLLKVLLISGRMKVRSF